MYGVNKYSRANSRFTHSHIHMHIHTHIHIKVNTHAFGGTQGSNNYNIYYITLTCYNLRNYFNVIFLDEENNHST